MKKIELLVLILAIFLIGCEPNEAAIEAATDSVKQLLGFYASTPAYRPPMEAVGYGDLQPTLNTLSKEGRWSELADYIDDDFVEAFCTRGTPDEVPAMLKARYGDAADRLAIYAPYAASDELWRTVIAELKAD